MPKPENLLHFDDPLALAGAILLVLWLCGETLLQRRGLFQPRAAQRENLSYRLLIFSYYGGIIYSLLDAAVLHWTTIGPRLGFLRWAGIPLVLAGVAVRIAARVSLGQGFSPHVQTTEGHRLVTTGIYGSIRHPLYLGYLCLLVGLPLCLGSVGGFACAILTGIPAIVYRIRVEEAALEKWFPEEYPQYRANTHKLIPGLW